MGDHCGNPAIPRVIGNRLKDRLKPKVLSGETLGNLRLFPAILNLEMTDFSQSQ
jgi:hypothetical protein